MRPSGSHRPPRSPSSRLGIAVGLSGLVAGCSAVTISTIPRPKPAAPVAPVAGVDASTPQDPQVAALKAQVEAMKDAQDDTQIAQLRAQQTQAIFTGSTFTNLMIQGQIDEIERRRAARKGIVLPAARKPPPVITAKPNYDQTQWFFLQGLVGSPVVEVDDVCRNGTVAQLQTVSTPANLAVSALTLGLLNPRTARVWCGD